MARGIDLLHDPSQNKGTAFTLEERARLGLRGLLPPRVHTQEEQVERVLQNLAAKPNALEKYIFLIGLQDRNEQLFYRVLTERLEELMPIVYTPTVGQACQQFGQIFRRPRGLYVSADDAGHVAELLDNWPNEARVVVVTDGERILGLGDLGANGMGIPVGKLSLYTACAGVDPGVCLPIMLDVGTGSEEVLADPLYIGLRRPRLRGAAYDALVEELVSALVARWPRVLVQFEDFGNKNAFRLLAHFRERVLSFNDDIQGTAAVALAGLLAALRLTGGALADQRVLFFGAGEAGTGIAELLVEALVQRGLSRDDARARCWLMDSQGLVTAARKGEPLAAHKLPLAHDHAPLRGLPEAVAALKPTALVGTSAQAGAFTSEVLARMGAQNERPIVFALSNPTVKSECTAHQALQATQGRAVFASGSPFDPVELDGKRFAPGQGNNVYIFPGVGLGVLASGSRRVTDEMFLAAAEALAAEVREEDLAVGRIYPALSRVREVSVAVATAVAELVWSRGLTNVARPADIRAHLCASMWEPRYH